MGSTSKVNCFAPRSGSATNKTTVFGLTACGDPRVKIRGHITADGKQFLDGVY